MSENKDSLPAKRPAQAPAPATSPFARMQSEHMNAGAVAIESERAIAEAQGKLVVAKRFPRDETLCFTKVVESCKRIGLAEVAFYSYPRGGQKVTGPSIRLAEELARCWRNIDYGLRELSQRDGETEMMAYAWDLEENTISEHKFVVKHIRDRQEGGKALTEQRDIYEIGANMGARRMRARILAILPAWYVDAAVEECKKTLAGGNGEPMADRIRKMVVAFEALGVLPKMMVDKFGHPIDQITPDELVELTGTYRSIRDGMSGVQDHFGAKPSDATKEAVRQQVQNAGKASPANDNAGNVKGEAHPDLQTSAEKDKAPAAAQQKPANDPPPPDKPAEPEVLF